MSRIPAQLARQGRGRPRGRAPFWAPVKRMPASIAPADRERLTREIREAIARDVIPAYRRFSEFFSGRSTCRRASTASAPGSSRAAPRPTPYLVRKHTTTKLTPQEVHDIGLREVARLRAALVAEMTRAGFKGGLPDFFPVAAVGPAVLLPRQQVALRRLRGHRKAHRPAPRRALQDAPANALRRRGHPRERRPRHDHGLLPRARRRRLARRHLLRQPLQAGGPPEVGDDGPHAPRERPRASPPGRARQRADGPPRVPPVRLVDRVRRGVGRLRRVARRGRKGSTTSRTPRSAASPTSCGARCAWSSTAESS